MAFYIVGTAGHIDHGKTELSKALTGVQTDRLKEEQERGMSIKLGFAPLVLEEGVTLGLVDVPGHERFIQQMMSGASGMDLVILVIAATEGIMPQTREHLDIVSLLGIRNLVVALTKRSLVDDEFLELVTEEVREYLAKRGYEEAPILPVDSLTMDGIDQLKMELLKQLKTLPPREEGSYPRLPIDRVFTLTGHGTVVTGTLWSGKIRKGDLLTLFPMNRTVKVRNLQVHGENVDVAVAGQRVALNIPDVSTREVPPGQVLLRESILKPTFKVTGLFRLLPDKETIGNLEKVRVHLGTSEILAKLIVLDGDEVYPGEERLCGLYLNRALGTMATDHLVVRKENATETLGGLEVIEANPGKFHRKDPAYLTSLRNKLEGSPLEKMKSIIGDTPFIDSKTLALRLRIDQKALEALMSEEVEDLMSIEGCYLTKEEHQHISERILKLFESSRKQNPLSQGIGKEELKSRLFPGLSPKTFNSLLRGLEGKLLVIKGDQISQAGVEVRLSPEDEALSQKILSAYHNDGWNAKSPKETAEALGLPYDRYMRYNNHLLNTHQLIKIDENILLHHEIYEKGLEAIIRHCEETGSIDIKEAKDILGGSRKYIVPFLEYLDYHKITKRLDNKRVLARRQ